jgi:hypothetical protein
MDTGFLVSAAMQAVLLTVYGIGWYWMCTLVWKRGAGSLSGGRLGRVALWNVLWNIVVIGLLEYGYQTYSDNGIIMMVLQILAGVLLIVLVPLTFCFYEQTSREKLPAFDIKSFLKSAWKHKTALSDAWIIFYFLLAGWDSLFAGPLSFAQGFDPCAQMINLWVLGNPVSYPATLISIGTAFEGRSELILLYVMAGLFFTWLAWNLIAWMPRLMAEPAVKTIPAQEEEEVDLKSIERKKPGRRNEKPKKMSGRKK